VTNDSVRPAKAAAVTKKNPSRTQIGSFVTEHEESHPRPWMSTEPVVRSRATRVPMTPTESPPRRQSGTQGLRDDVFPIKQNRKTEKPEEDCKR
jgi:hypothetical protein